MKIARMPYINVDPFFYTLEYEKEEPLINLVSVYPRRMGELAHRKDALDAGTISVMDFLKLQDTYEPLDKLCVAVKSKAGSVTLFSKTPLEKLRLRKIGITNQTSTSKVLLRIILENRYGISSIEYIDNPEPGNVDAYLFIGNAALTYTHTGLKGFKYIYDIGEEWYKWTGLPFVFAIWAVNKNMKEPDRQRLIGILNASLDVFGKYEKSMAKKRAAELSLSPSIIEDYWHLFIYRQTETVDKSLELFISYVKRIKEIWHG